LKHILNGVAALLLLTAAVAVATCYKSQGWVH
jgi:hypothetical protein